MGPPRASRSTDSAGYAGKSSSDLPLDQGGVWHTGSVQVASSDERYALFTPPEIFGKSGASLRRVDAEASDMSFDDAYEALVETQDQWYLDRRDVNQPHSSDWPSFSPDFWCSTDCGKVCFHPVSDSSTSSKASSLGMGQYHKAVGEEWQCYGAKTSPGNVGGFHSCCVDTGQPRSDWTLVARLADFGSALDRSAGIRVEFAALVRNDSESLAASLGTHDECRALFRVADVTLPTGKVLLTDPADVHYFVQSSATKIASSDAELSSNDCVDDGPCVPSGLGAGLYPVILSQDMLQKICRISLVFHPLRASKISKTFPPADPQQTPQPAQAVGRAQKPPLPPSRSRSKDTTLLV